MKQTPRELTPCKISHICRCSFNAQIIEVKKYLPIITNLATTAALNAKINEIKNKIPNITNLPTTTARTAAEYKTPNVSNLAKKTDYNTKIKEIENKITADQAPDKYITAHEFNKSTSENFIARPKQANLVFLMEQNIFLQEYFKIT